MNNLFNMAVILSAVNRASGPIGQVARSMGDLVRSADRVAAAGMQMTVAGAMTQAAAGQMGNAIGGMLRPAIQFESTMADVKKVVNFDTPAAFQQMSDDVLALSTRIPMAVDGLGQIMAAAGQAGIPRQELLRFTEDAAKMGVAFDMSGAEAGGAMTGLRTIFKLTQDEVVSLGDAVNHLGNNMDASASGMLNIMNRAGSTGKLIGLTGQQVAALGATFLALKTPPEVASTGMNALFNKLATADKQGGKFQAALASMGYSAEELKAALEQDAQGALIDFLETVETSDDVMGTLTDLFGAEYADDMAKLVGGLDTYREALGYAGDDAAYAGSMQREYEARAETTANALQTMSNIMNRLGITIGALVLPEVNDALEVLQDLALGFTDFAKANPLLFKIALGFFGILTAALMVIAPILTIVGGLTMMGSYGLKGVQKVALGFGWLRAKIVAALPALWSFITSTLRFAAAGAGRFAVAVGQMAISLVSSLLPALGSAIAGAWAFTAALLANPITWIVLAIAAAAALIYVFWDPIAAFFTGLWGDVQAAFNAGWVDGVLKVLEMFNPLVWVAKGMDALVQYLFGIDLSAAGANIINTIWEGMKSVASKPAEAMAEIVAKVREYLPFSPAKVGPLSDLDQIKLVETVADSLSPDSLTSAIGAIAQAARNALPESLTMPLQAAWDALPSMDAVRSMLPSLGDLGAMFGIGQAVPAPVPASVPAAVAAPLPAPVPQMVDMPRTGSAAPAAAGGVTVNIPITIEGSASDATVERLERWARENGRLLADLVMREQNRAARTSFGG